jgi:hypothetical protein
MVRFEYMCLPIHIVSPGIVDQYKLLPFVQDGWVYVEIRKGMHGLPQAGIIANQRLEKHLAKYGYKPTYLTPGLWRHQFRPIAFSLVVNNFGIKYVSDEHAQHLIKALEDLYTVSSDWTVSLYCGLTLEWDCKNCTIDLSMPNHVATALHKFQHLPPSRRQHAPHKWTRPLYGARVQYAHEPNDKALLPAANIKRVPQVFGTLSTQHKCPIHGKGHNHQPGECQSLLFELNKRGFEVVQKDGKPNLPRANKASSKDKTALKTTPDNTSISGIVPAGKMARSFTCADAARQVSAPAATSSMATGTTADLNALDSLDLDFGCSFVAETGPNDTSTNTTFYLAPLLT